MSERVIGATARLLAGAAVLIVVGLGLVLRLAWLQVGESYGPDGTATQADVPFADHLTMMVFELSYRPVGSQLMLASMLVGAAVMALHLYPTRSRIVRLRWEVLCAGLVVLVVVAGLVLATAYVMTAPDGPEGDVTGWIGPQPVTGLALGNLATLCAPLLTLAAATLWWMPLGSAAADVESVGDSEGSVEQEAATNDPAPTPASGDPSDSVDVADGEATTDYSRDWSPEDFRPSR